MNDDIKALVQELNSLTGILSSVKEARIQSNRVTNYASSSKFSSAYHARPYSTYPVQRNTSMTYKKSFSLHNTSVVHPSSSHRFINPKLTKNNVENVSRPVFPNKFCNGNVNTRYAKTNANKAVSVSQKVNTLSQSKVTGNVEKIDASLNKNVPLCDVKIISIVDIGGAKCISSSNSKCSDAKESQTVSCDIVPSLNAPSKENDVSKVLDEIITKVDNANEKTCSIDPSSEVKGLELLCDSVQETYQESHDLKESSGTTAAKESVCEKLNKLLNELPKASSKLLVKDDFSNKKVLQNNATQSAQNSKQVWKSKYKVINRHIDSNVMENKNVKYVQHSNVFKADPKQIICSYPLFHDKYKLLTKCQVPVKCSVNKISPSTNKLLNLANSTSIKNENVPSLKSGLHEFPSKKLCTSVRGSSFAKVTSPNINSSAKLTMKLKELELQTRSHYEGYDLSHISPMELVALDHKGLLKLAAGEKKSKSFVKKSKYKLESKSPAKKQWNELKTISAMKSRSKLRTPRKSLYLSKARVVTPQRMKYQIGSSTKYVKPVLKNIATDENTPKTLVNRLSQSGTAGLLTNTPLQARNVASRVLNRSIRSIRKAIANKKPSPKSEAYCIFFNRFGRCNTGDSCPYIHDPKKIAVCTRFLKGSCKRKGCPFSHEINPGKMAICSFYLRGACKKDNLCPYRHELLKPGTELCKAFVRGYCPNGSQCEKAHILSCPDHMSGCCDKSDCQYPHPPKKGKRKIEDNFVNSYVDISNIM